ncbi:MAG: hypothetical protein SOV62_00525 [Alloprevotella sp.]|nr:hypothetical protein [Alloprevotella sp.]
MDYAIFKTTDGNQPRVIHRFTQEENNHRAKEAARTKLHEMWLHVLQRPALHRNATGTKDEFQYEHISSVNTFERIRFYIDNL